MIFDKRTEPKATMIGIIRQIDALGRVSLPQEYRTLLNWQIGDDIVQEKYNDNTIVFYRPTSETNLEKEIVRKIDNFGRITCSSKMRSNILKVSTFESVELMLFDDKKIYTQKFEKGCII